MWKSCFFNHILKNYNFMIFSRSFEDLYRIYIQKKIWFHDLLRIFLRSYLDVLHAFFFRWYWVVMDGSFFTWIFGFRWDPKLSTLNLIQSCPPTPSPPDFFARLHHVHCARPDQWIFGHQKSIDPRCTSRRFDHTD